MAYPPGMLVRKDGNIQFQYRIPKDLLQHYPRPIMSENLGTSNRALAARMIHARKAELEREFQRLRSQTAQVPVPRRASSQTMKPQPSPEQCWPRRFRQMKSCDMMDLLTPTRFLQN